MPRTLRFLLLAAAVVSVPAGVTPAAGQVQGACQAAFNGVEAERIASLSSPLLLGNADTLTVTGTDAVKTTHASLTVRLGPATLGHQEVSSGTAESEFEVALPLSDVAPYAVGLLRVRATTDNCTVEVWLRLGGRIAFTTLIGLTGTGLAVAGLTGQISALLARRRWSIPVAASAGVATGAGGALLGQEFGRLQLSYPSLAICIAVAALVGLGLALLLRRRPATVPAGEAADEPEAAEAVPKAAPAAAPVPATPRARPAERPIPATPAAPRPAPTRAVPAASLPSPQEPAPARASARTPAAGPFWSYVMADVEVLGLDDYTRVVATLHPGTWYLAKREVSGWAQVVAAPGVEGWVPRQALHREG